MGSLMPDALHDVFARYPVTLSIGQCAELLGVQPQTVYRRLKLDRSDPRRIPGHQPGGGPGWTIYRDEIEAYVRRGDNLPDDPPPN
jgi:excisionase family DNA binding protein